MTEPTEFRDFFISFTGADREWAAWIAWTIEEAGYSVWFQDWDFNGNFVVEMDRAHTRSRRTIAVLSPDYLKSRFAAPEWAARFAEDATSAHDLLVPIRIVDFKPTGLLAQIVYVDLVGVDDERAKERLLERLSGVRLKPGEAPLYPTIFGHLEVSRKPNFPGMVRASVTMMRQALIGGGVLAAVIGALLTWSLTKPGQTIHGVPFEEYQKLLAERNITSESLGVTDQALAAFFAIMEEDDVPRDALEMTLKEIARRYNDLLARLENATPNADQQVKILKAKVGDALSKFDLDAAERLLNQAIELDNAAIERMEAVLDARKLSVAESEMQSGDLMMMQLRFIDAASRFKSAVESTPAEYPKRLTENLLAWADAAWKAGDYEAGMEAARRKLALNKQRLPADSLELASDYGHLATFHLILNDFSNAELLYNNSISIYENHNIESKRLADLLNNLATLYQETDRFDQAEQYYKRSLDMFERVAGTDTREVAWVSAGLADLYRLAGRYPEAESMVQRALAIAENQQMLQHPDSAFHMKVMAEILDATGRFTEAAAFYRRALKIYNNTVHEDHHYYLETKHKYDSLLDRTRHLEK